MKIVISVGHAQIAQRIEHLLAARGDEAVGLVRNPNHIAGTISDHTEPAGWKGGSRASLVSLATCSHVQRSRICRQLMVEKPREPSAYARICEKQGR